VQCRACSNFILAVTATTVFAKANICSFSTPRPPQRPRGPSPHQWLPTGEGWAVSPPSRLGMAATQTEEEAGAPRSAPRLKPPSWSSPPALCHGRLCLRWGSQLRWPEPPSSCTLGGVLDPAGGQAGCWGAWMSPRPKGRGSTQPEGTAARRSEPGDRASTGVLALPSTRGGWEHPSKHSCCQHGGCVRVRSGIRRVRPWHTCSETLCHQTHRAAGSAGGGCRGPPSASPPRWLPHGSPHLGDVRGRGGHAPWRPAAPPEPQRGSEPSLARQLQPRCALPGHAGSGLHARLLLCLLCSRAVTDFGAVPRSRGPPRGEKRGQALHEALTGRSGCCRWLPKDTGIDQWAMFWGLRLSSAHSRGGPAPSPSASGAASLAGEAAGRCRGTRLRGRHRRHGGRGGLGAQPCAGHAWGATCQMPRGAERREGNLRHQQEAMAPPSPASLGPLLFYKMSKSAFSCFPPRGRRRRGCGEPRLAPPAGLRGGRLEVGSREYRGLSPGRMVGSGSGAERGWRELKSAGAGKSPQLPARSATVVLILAEFKMLQNESVRPSRLRGAHPQRIPAAAMQPRGRVQRPGLCPGQGPAAGPCWSWSGCLGFQAVRPAARGCACPWEGQTDIPRVGSGEVRRSTAICPRAHICRGVAGQTRAGPRVGAATGLLLLRNAVVLLHPPWPSWWLLCGPGEPGWRHSPALLSVEPRMGVSPVWG